MNNRIRSRCAVTLLAALSAIAFACGTADNPVSDYSAVLVGYAALPADTFAGGPTSGRHLGNGEEAINGQPVPFVGKQPVQGFSAVIADVDGTFLAMADNGYGSIENSADFNLRVYRIRPSFRTSQGGSGTIEVLEHFELRDPSKVVPFAITNQFTSERVLTGSDFDIESMRKAPDGSFWFGDEFGPFLLHTDSQGVMLEAPIELANFDDEGTIIRAPQNPDYEEATAVRIMNAVKRHAELFGNQRTPVFSPFNVMLTYEDVVPSSSGGRGDATFPDLPEASLEVFSVQSIRTSGYPIVTWTVNDKPRMLELLGQGVDGIISDRSDLLYEALGEFDADGDGTGGDYLTSDGLVDQTKFDAQGHRGSRNLRPENTLPAMEVALDNLMSTLELDTGVTKDGAVVLKHDPYIERVKCRLAATGTCNDAAQVEPLIKDLTLAEIQGEYICDCLFRGPTQVNDRGLSPVTVQFTADQGLMDAYVLPTLDQVFDFVDAYIDYYQTGAGMAHPAAMLRVKNAMQVRFNVETKVNPRTDRDLNGNIYIQRTIPYKPFTEAVASVIERHGMTERADIQSFDFRTLLYVQEHFPAIRTVYLFGDFPIFAGGGIGDDGTNLQDQDGANSPWMAGMYWPYRSTVRTQPMLAKSSGGFEGMAMSPDGSKLYPMLEKPVDDTDTLLIFEFDIATRSFTGVRYEYPLDGSATAEFPKAHAIGDFTLIDGNRGLVIERDSTQGDLTGYKKIHLITLPDGGGKVTKSELVDLMRIADFNHFAAAAQGDVGNGSETFAFPYVTIENIIKLDDHTIGVMNDNNYPFSVGRHVDGSRPDDTEFIQLYLPSGFAN